MTGHAHEVTRDSSGLTYGVRLSCSCGWSTVVLGVSADDSIAAHLVDVERRRAEAEKRLAEGFGPGGRVEA